ELIEDMYKKTQEGFDVVYGKRLARKGETFFKRWTASVFYSLINMFCDVTIPVDTGDFRLISNQVLNVLKQMREQHRFVRGMIPWVGFKSAPVYYNRDERFAGVTKYPLKKMIKFYYEFKNKLHPFVIACLIHAKFEEIHPFEDGNGRTGRAIMNWILMKGKYPKIYIPVKQLEKYYKALDLHNEKKIKEYCNKMFEIIVEQFNLYK
ncbi:MAG: Fic family protein, partial [Nanoarchaeota archaeon]|nr:Fic family protein [Nanoarchaeota archaeon]